MNKTKYNFKILITGGSGFIGTNLIELLAQKGFRIKNVDIQAPFNSKHNEFWENVDILNHKALLRATAEFNPDYIIHLAAKADLLGKNLEYYDVNISGVKNLVKVINEIGTVQRCIITSTMLVCRTGYLPKLDNDYCPDTFYGRSKVQTEEIVKNCENIKTEWVIVRPSSIWGPWFKNSYRSFFYMLMDGRYFDLGERSCTKTYGYVGNTVDQIYNILMNDGLLEKIYYLGDDPEYNISEWANEICDIINFKKPIKAPFVLFKLAAIFGDMLGMIKVNFPLNSFRLKNMTTNNVVPLNSISKLVAKPLYTRGEGIKKTHKWLENRSRNFNYR